MENFNDHNRLNSHAALWQRPRAEVSLFAAFTAGLIVAMAAMYLAVARPIADELDRLQGRMADIDRSLKGVAGERKTAKDANDLLALLTEQGQRSASATEALDRFRALQDRLVGEKLRVDRASASLDQIDALQEQLINQESRVADATTSLVALEQVGDQAISLQTHADEASQSLSTAQATLESLIELQGRTVEQEGSIAATAAILDQWNALGSRLRAASTALPTAWCTSNELIGLQENLIERGTATPEAREALETLLGIRDRLAAQDEMETARRQAEALIALKDSVLAQTTNLAEAIETLELANDLDQQLQKVVRSFDRMRHAMIEILAFEPTIERAILALEPLTSLGNLRHLNQDELRNVARSIRDGRKSPLERVETLPATLSTPTGPSATRRLSDGAEKN